MKVIYNKQTGALLDAAHVLLGDINPYEQSTDAAMVAEILRQNRPLLQKDAEPEDGCPERFVVSQNRPRYELANEKAAVTGEDSPEQFLVWVCYITDNYGNPLVVKVVPTKKKALEWLSDEPHAIGKKKDDEVRGRRFVESFVLEVERP